MLPSRDDHPLLNAPGAALVRANALLARLERRCGPRGAAAVLALALLAGGALYAGLSFVPYNFGVNYAHVSENPFDFAHPDPVQFRLLGPLLGYLLHLRGNAFPLLTHGASALLLAILYLACRRRRWEPIEALGLTALLAFSYPVLNELHGAGRIDPLSYLFVLGAMLTVRRPVAYWACLSLALLTHESNAFALPGLLALRMRWPATKRDWAAHAAATALALLPWAAARIALDAAIQSPVPYSLGFYLRADNLHANVASLSHTLYVGAFGAFKLGWLLPLLAIGIHGTQPDGRPRALLLLLMIAAPAAQCLIAEDVTRMWSLAFPAILLAAADLRAAWGGPNLSRLLWLLVFLNLLIPTIGVAGSHMAIYHSLPYLMLVQFLLGIPLP